MDTLDLPELKTREGRAVAADMLTEAGWPLLEAGFPRYDRDRMWSADDVLAALGALWQVASRGQRRRLCWMTAEHALRRRVSEGRGRLRRDVVDALAVGRAWWAGGADESDLRRALSQVEHLAVPHARYVQSHLMTWALDALLDPHETTRFAHSVTLCALEVMAPDPLDAQDVMITEGDRALARVDHSLDLLALTMRHLLQATGPR